MYCTYVRYCLLNLQTFMIRMLCTVGSLKLWTGPHMRSIVICSISCFPAHTLHSSAPPLCIPPLVPLAAALQAHWQSGQVLLPVEEGPHTA